VLAAFALAVAAAAGWRYRITRPDYRLARGQEAVAAKDWAAAEGYVGKLEAAGRIDHARLLAAEIYHARGRPDQALTALNRMDPDGPFRARRAVLAGRCLLDLRVPREAYRAFREVLAEDPENPDALRGLAAITYDLGQMGEALGLLAKVAELDPADPRPYRLVGLIQADGGNPEAAEAAYRAALARNPAPDLTAELRLELAQALLQQKKYAEATEVLDAARAAAGGDEPAYMLLIRAECLRAAGRRAEAAALVDRAIALDPRGGLLYKLRGQLLMDEDRPAEAAAALEQARKLLPAHYQTQFLLAQALAAAGRKPEADAAFAKAEELKRENELLSELTRQASARPWDPGLRLKLAEVCDRLARPELAAMWRAAAAALTGGGPGP
jgi:tetratricopeptide (TPR) repeat protein